MSEKRGKGTGPAWAEAFNAGATEDREEPRESTPARGQRNKSKAREAPSAVSSHETSYEGVTLPQVHAVPIPQRRKTQQFNNRIPVDLVAKVKAEVEEYEAEGLQRTQGDIVADALTFYYEMKDRNRQ